MSDPVTRLKAARSGRSVGRFRVSVHSTRFEVSGWGSPGSRVSCRQYAATPGERAPRCRHLDDHHPTSPVRRSVTSSPTRSTASRNSLSKTGVNPRRRKVVLSLLGQSWGQLGNRPERAGTQTVVPQRLTGPPGSE